MAEKRSPLVRLECPNCTSPINQYNATTQSVICPSCGSTVAIGMGDPEVLSKGRSRIPPSPFPIKIGDTCNIANTEYIVLGRVVYKGWDDEDSWTWHEWLLGGSDGRMIWMSHDETGFGLFRKMRFRSPFNAQSDFQLDIGNGQKAFIHERYPAVIEGAEGELTWRAKAGDQFFVAEGAGAGKKFSVQQSPHELEVYEGRAITEKAIATAFGNQDWINKLDKAKRGKSTGRALAFAFLLFAVIAFIVGGVVSASGEELEPQYMNLSTSSPSDSFVVDFDKAKRPAIISIALNNMGIPENTFVDFDVNIVAPDEQIYFLFSQELWHETGRDEDGPWRETHYRHSEMFVPLLTGNHKIEVVFDTTNPVPSANIAVTVRKNHIMPTWFVIYGVVTGIIGALLLFSNSGRATAAK